MKNIVKIAESIPMISHAAKLLQQLIAICDSYLCNKEAFEALKIRLENIVYLYFNENGKFLLYEIIITY